MIKFILLIYIGILTLQIYATVSEGGLMRMPKFMTNKQRLTLVIRFLITIPACVILYVFVILEDSISKIDDKIGNWGDGV